MRNVIILLVVITAVAMAADKEYGKKSGDLRSKGSGGSNNQAPTNDGDNESHSEVSSFSQRQSETANGSGGLPTIVSSQSSVSVSQKCSNGKCESCVNGKCFKNSASYTSVIAIDGCPVVACTTSCNHQVKGADGCPICSCKNGKGVREPCQSASDCPKTSTGCGAESACGYSNVPADLPGTCTYAYECPSDKNCVNGSCAATKSGGTHLEGQQCIFDYECPSKYSCDGSTCWDGGLDHQEYVSCGFDFNCKSGYKCKGQTCYAGGLEHIEGLACVFQEQCPKGYKCSGMAMTCVRQ